MNEILEILIQTLFIWLPVILFFVFRDAWLSWRRAKWLHKLKWTLLEVSIPKEVHKSPEAMELIFNTLHEGGGMGTWIKKLIDGARLQFASLEMVSIEGSIYFFIRVQTKYAGLVKNQIYAQYPQAEVHEVDDYTSYLGDYTKKQDLWELFGVEFELTSDDFFPIKTYVDYGLDKAVGSLEEEQKIDPLTPLIEFLGSMRQHEQVWMQVIIRADKGHAWKDKAKAEIQKLMGRGKEDASDFGKMTHGEQERVKAIERSMHKPGFEVGFRTLYLAKQDVFRPSNISGMIGSVKQFGAAHMNGFKPGLTTDFDYPWQDISGKRLPKLKRAFFDNYIKRAYFYDIDTDKAEPDDKPSFVLNSEELATIFRFPGRVSETVSLERIESTKAEPPSNLPI